MNKNKKGYNKERSAILEYETMGWRTWKPSRSRFNSNDVFGLFDFLAIREDKRDYIQVKSIGKESNFSILSCIHQYNSVGISLLEFAKLCNVFERVILVIYFDGRWKGRGKTKKFIKPTQKVYHVLGSGEYILESNFNCG